MATELYLIRHGESVANVEPIIGGMRGDAGLTDRGVLAEGRRADLILVDDAVPLRPRIVGVIAAGRLVHLTEADRLIRFTAAPRKAVAAA